MLEFGSRSQRLTNVAEAKERDPHVGRMRRGREKSGTSEPIKHRETNEAPMRPGEYQ